VALSGPELYLVNTASPLRPTIANENCASDEEWEGKRCFYKMDLLESGLCVEKNGRLEVGPKKHI
jgi:hypothetical protein